jgi:hypothetical protein
LTNSATKPLDHEHFTGTRWILTKSSPVFERRTFPITGLKK